MIKSLCIKQLTIDPSDFLKYFIFQVIGVYYFFLNPQKMSFAFKHKILMTDKFNEKKIKNKTI